MTNRVDGSSYRQYQSMRHGYRVELRQDGDRVTGRGQKWTENGREIPWASRTLIEVEGTLEGRRLALTYTEHGARAGPVSAPSL